MAAVRKATGGGVGADVLLEMSGNPSAIVQGLTLCERPVLPRYWGIPSEPIKLDLANAIVFKSATVQGINGRRMFETWFQARSLLKAALILLL